ncbi:hypothetical protein ACA910_018637 [Epithemia clementina (nom. ined.)]
MRQASRLLVRNSHNEQMYSTDDIASCAIDGVCSIEEMELMMQELEKFDSSHNNNDYNNNNVDEIVVETYVNRNSRKERKMLKDALKLRMELQRIGKKIEANTEQVDDSEDEEIYMYSSYQGESNHAFDHFVDYRQMAQYESH